MPPCPAPVLSLTDVRSLAANSGTFYGLRGDGTVWYWGGGQTSTTTPFTTVPLPLTVSQVDRYRFVTAGAGGFALVSDSGSLYYSTTGVYGNAGGFSVKTGLGDVLEASVGAGHTCALRVDGSVFCWGDNGDGTLGDGTHTDSVLTQVVDMDDAVALASTRTTACALRAGGTVACWGSNKDGALGTGDPLPADSPAPVDVVGLDAVASIAGAGDSPAVPRLFCAVNVDGTVACWGTHFGATPQVVPGVTGATEVDIDGLGALSILLDDGTALRSSAYMPTALDPIPEFATGLANPDVATGYHHTCALRSRGTVACWGDNTYGQLGDTSTTSTNEPVAADIDGVIEIAAWGDHTCAIRSDGSLWCWGNNLYDQLGPDAEGLTHSPHPLQVRALENVVAVAPGSRSTCAVTHDGQAWCWGDNTYGQLGDGTNTSRVDPALVAGLDGVRTLASGGIHMCAGRYDGSVWCWGRGFSGELGNGLTGAGASSTVAVPVQELDGVIAVAAGHATTCAVRVDGGSWCWGNDVHGLGDGAASGPQPYPTQVSALSGGVDAAMGSSAQCVRTALGTVHCFGTNTYGELGDPTAPLGVDALWPVLVGGAETALDGVIALDSGFDHSCAVQVDDRVSCWGLGSQGQLGNGASLNQNAPVLVVGW